MPLYAQNGEWDAHTPLTVWIKRIILGVLLSFVGYKVGTLDAEADTLLMKSKVVEFEVEEQIFDYLYNQHKTAVFLSLYTPGHLNDEKFNATFERESSKYNNNTEDDIVFMRVLCREHLNFCVNKMWAARQLPACEVYFIDEQDKIELVDFGSRHRSP